jgi:hypothetical protein
VATVTCRTEGCANADIPIDLTLTYVDDGTGETRTVDSVACGVCGQPIEDVRT